MDLARLAGRRIMEIRSGADLDTKAKPDGTPVTRADVAAQDLILPGLQSLTPSIPIVSEEQINTPDLTQTGTYWLVDPLDGTRDFVAGGNGFSVNIGLLVKGIPCLGVIYAPAMEEMLYGDSLTCLYRRQNGIEQLAPPPSCPPQMPPDILTSQREARRLPIPDWQRHGDVKNWTILSGAFKFALLALGRAHLYVRTGITYEWDTAAGDAILRSLGGRILTPDMNPLTYNKPAFRNATFLASATADNMSLMPHFFDLIQAVD